MNEGRGLVEERFEESDGNASLLVLEDSSGAFWDHYIVRETVLTALKHFGMPYRLRDLAKGRLTADEVSKSSAVVIAQSRMGSSLSDSDQQVLVEAVEEQGVGLINFDNDIRLYSDRYNAMFGFEDINPHLYATNLLRIKPVKHYITGMQDAGEWHELDRMVTATIPGRYAKDVTILAEGILGKDQLVYIRHIAPWSAYEPANHPLVAAVSQGKGRAVQFLVNPRIWRNEFFGHARGIDDLFWRSIVWAVKKPFAANMVPPFVLMSFDDCSGRYDFRYAEMAAAYGYQPMTSLFLNNVPERLYPVIRDIHTRTGTCFNTHALGYYDHMIMNLGKSDCSDDELKRNFAEHDAFWKKIGIAPLRTNRLHLGEYGTNALPYLKERGLVFFDCPVMQMGLLKSEACISDGYRPYGKANCFYDYLPDDHDFFIYASMNVRHQEDFLNGFTPYVRQCDKVDIEKAAVSGAAQIKMGLRAGFPGEIPTHEQKMEVTSLDEWDAILKRVGELTKGFEKKFVNHDFVAEYLKGKDSSWLSEVTVKDDHIQCRLSGSSGVPLEVSVFQDRGDQVTRDYVEAPAFDGKTNVDAG